MCSPRISYWPQISDFEQLYNENPNTIFILNKRDPEKILLSFKKWNSLHKRLYKYNPELIKNQTDIGFINFVKEHYNKIETFFSLRPNAKFMFYDIENDDIDKLKKYIDIKNMKSFPHENENKNKGQIAMKFK